MPVPVIKLYELPEGYVQSQDSDLRSEVDDELLPVVDRSQLLVDAVPLTGIIPVDNEDLQPLDLVTGRANYSLVMPSALIQTPVGLAVEDIINSRGTLGIQVYDGDNRLMTEDQWDLKPDGFHFQPGVCPSGGRVSCYRSGGVPTIHWALQGSSLYAGSNDCFNQLLVRIDGGPLQATTQSGGQLTLGTPASRVQGTYAVTDTFSRWWIGDHPNWVVGHLNMNPDVFVGLYDYPGDASLINGVPFEPGLVPKFVDPTMYALDARRGMVAFPQAVDTTQTIVQALYAHYDQLGNVTGQRLTAVDASGVVFQATSETAFPDSHGKPWVMRDTNDMPLNVYVSCALAPGITSVTPYDQLGIVTS